MNERIVRQTLIELAEGCEHCRNCPADDFCNHHPEYGDCGSSIIGYIEEKSREEQHNDNQSNND